MRQSNPPFFFSFIPCCDSSLLLSSTGLGKSDRHNMGWEEMGIGKEQTKETKEIEGNWRRGKKGMKRNGGVRFQSLLSSLRFLRIGEGRGVSPPIPFFTSSFFSIFVHPLSPPFVSTRKANVG